MRRGSETRPATAVADARPARRHGLLLGLMLCVLAFPLAPVCLASPPQKLDLRAALERARRANPFARMQELRSREAQLGIRAVEALRFLPELSWKQSFGLVPAARGDVLFSPDSRDDLDGLGPFYRAELSFVQPVLTFGRIGHGLRAASRNADAAAAEGEEAIEALSAQVIRAFWGVAAARELVELAGDLERGYEMLLAEVQEKAAEESSRVDDVDVMEVRSFRYAVVRVVEDARAREATATSALQALLDLPATAELDLEVKASPDWSLTDADLEGLRRRAERSDGHAAALRFKVASQEAKIELARAERLPLVLLGGGFRYSYAPNRDKQENPFVLDDWNFRSIGAALSVRWDLNLVRQRIEIARLQVQRDRLEAQAGVRDLTLRHEVDSVFAEARRAERLVEAAETSLNAARTWLRLSQDNWSLGIGDTARLLRAYEALYRLSGEAIQARFLRSVAVAEAALTVGDVGLYLSWVDGGEIVVENE